MHFLGRVVTFALIIIFFSLLQLWVLLVFLNRKDIPIQLKEVLGGGGLFFFATSLCVSSAVSLHDFRPMKIGGFNLIVTLIVCAMVLWMVIHYAVALTDVGMTAANPFGENVQMQIGCALAAFLYWFFAGSRSNLFIKDDGSDA
ncbi:MAG: hypothetical protein KAV87_15060 [Desulfobacteraceae bacterium]|nr:hypothetical protein [Desulfobacteraceae bacterium]